jgi:ABC-2 type transport system ATP-binding protein
VLVTSHILGEIERVADRAAILLDGRLLGVHRLRAGGARQRFRLRVRGAEAAVRDRLARVAGVRRAEVEREPGSDVVATVVETDGSGAAEALAAAVVEGGFGLLDLRPAPADLETLFLGLTSRGPEVPA